MIEIPKEDYYANMYDIENLTDLNSERGVNGSSAVLLNIEKLISSNQCQKALHEIEQLLIESPANKELHILCGALKIKNTEFSGLCNSDLSPKNSALLELSRYLNLSTSAIAKLMLVEKPVASSWKKLQPNPMSEDSVETFYMETDSYVYELMAANNIVQTLYSYYVLIEKMKNLNVSTILDYGAGAATLSIIFNRFGYDITYADLPGKTFNFAKWRIDQRKLSIPMINLRQTSNISKKYDCVVSTEVVEHVVDPPKLISTLSNVLNKNGVCIISESCEYVEDFSSHLANNEKYGGEKFIELMNKHSFTQILKDPFIPQLIFQKT